MLRVCLLEQIGRLAITISQALLWTDGVLTFSSLAGLGVCFVTDLALADTIHTTSMRLVVTDKPICVQDELRDRVKGFGCGTRMTEDVFVWSRLSGLGLFVAIDLCILLLWLEGSLEITRLADVLIAFRKSTNELDSVAICLRYQHAGCLLTQCLVADLLISSSTSLYARIDSPRLSFLRASSIHSLNLVVRRSSNTWSSILV